MATFEFEKSLDNVCKQLIKKNNSNYGAFYLLVGIVVFVAYITILLTYKLGKFIVNKIKEVKKMNELKKKQEAEHLRCKELLTQYLQTSNCILSFDVLHSQTNKFNETKQNINFYGFNQANLCIDNINELVNGVVYNTLEIESKGYYKDSIIMDAKDLIVLIDDLSKEYGTKIKARCIK